MMKPTAMTLLCLLATVAQAWHSEGHERIVTVAVSSLGNRIPGFVAAGQTVVAEASVDPDTFKFRTGIGALRDSEYPQHFFDLELFTDDALPPDRLDFFFWCLRHDVSIQGIGTLPYALVEWTERLTIALAEHRRWPDNVTIQNKCLVYARNLAHYAGDLGQPLHTTIHHDGRVPPGGTSPRTGIHRQVDALLDNLGASQPPPIHATALQPYQDLLADILAEIKASNRRVDDVYALAGAFPSDDDDSPIAADSALGQLGLTLWQESARVTANLILTAWEISEDVDLPQWLER